MIITCYYISNPALRRYISCLKFSENIINQLSKQNQPVVSVSLIYIIPAIGLLHVFLYFQQNQRRKYKENKSLER